MIEDFVFEASPWELFTRKLKPHDHVSAAELLTMLEGCGDETMEEAFDTLEDYSAQLDVWMLPKVALTGEIGKRLALEERLVRKWSPLPDLPEEDPLRLYLEELARIPACGDEEVLALELADANRQGVEDEGLQTRLMNLCLSRVVDLAKEYMGRGVLLLDLIQEGSMGLWKGILVYTGQDLFCHHRDWWIRQYMARAVTMQARQCGVGDKLRKALEDYRMVDHRLLTQLGRNPTIEEIAQEMNITPLDAQVYEDMLRTAQLLEKAHAPKAEPTPEDEQAVEDTAYFQSRQRVAELLSTLSEQEAKVLSLRFGLEGGMPCSAQDTGARLGLTASEVTALEAAAMAKLRQQ